MKGMSLVIKNRLEVDARLRELGISAEELREPVRVGVSARAGCTKNDPPMFPGLLQFAVTVRTIRELKAPDGWMRNDYKNFSTVVRADGLVAIAIARGDDGTGNRDATVSTKYPKGAATSEAVQQNLRLPFEDRDVAHNKASGRVSTWFLLHSRTKDEVQIELAHPTWVQQRLFISRTGYIEKWDVRLILNPFSLNQSRLPVDDTRQSLDEIVGDKGYHSNQTLIDLDAVGIRSYVSEPDRGRRDWSKDPEARAPVYGNRRRCGDDAAAA